MADPIRPDAKQKQIIWLQIILRAMYGAVSVDLKGLAMGHLLIAKLAPLAVA
jgi:hypothetical protein